MTIDSAILNVLQQNGLSDSESLVYTASLSLGERSAGMLAKRAGIKRATTYLVIDRLVEKGLLISRKSSRGLLYRPASPYLLLERQQQACFSLEQNLPLLAALSSRSAEPPKFQIEFGKESISRFWDTCVNPRSDVLYWADARLTSGVDEVIDGVDIDRMTLFPSDANIVAYVKRRVANRTWVRGIIPYERNKQLLAVQGLLELQNQYLQLKKSGQQQLREFVCVSREDFPLPYEVTILDDTLTFVSYNDAMITRVKSASVAACMRSIFYMNFAYAKTRELELLSEEDRAYLTR